ncbi:hypothetical protein JCM16303_007278 [Sporobolomyces ruberrimus]
MNDPSKKRGRRLNDELPPSRSRDVQRAFRARRAAHAANLESRNQWLENECEALRTRIGLAEGQYLTEPPPKEIEPDYEGVTEPHRVRGSNKRTTKGLGKKPIKEKAADVVQGREGSSESYDWIKELGANGDGGASGSGSAREEERGQSLDTPDSTFDMTLPHPGPSQRHTPSTPFPTFPSQVAQDGSLNYGVYFVPKGSEQASFVGNTLFGAGLKDLEAAFSDHSQGQVPSGQSMTPSTSLPPLASPDAFSSTSSAHTSAFPTTPPDGWGAARAEMDGSGHGRTRERQKETFQLFHSCMSRVFGKGQVEDSQGDFSLVNRNSSTVSPYDPPPTIQLPRFSSGLPGSASSAATSSSTDTYLHISKVFEHFAPFVVPQLSNPAPRLTPPHLVRLLQAQEQSSLLQARPGTFDFSRPPTCLFLPPFSSTPSTSGVLRPGPRKEIYVLAQAVASVQRRLESAESSIHFA